MCDFSHLHCHSQFSLLDGAARIDRMVGRAQELGMTALGLTDHGNLFGVPEFYTRCKKAGIVPVIGSEFYVTPSGMGDKKDRTRYHQVLFAKDLTGYRNLIKLASLSYTDGFYYKPRIDAETLAKHSEGLIASTCCLQGEVLQTILKKGEEEGKKVFERYLGIFGDDYYVEIQDHDIPEQDQCNQVLLRWAEEYGVTVIATNDVHYVDRQDNEAQDILLCLQTGKEFSDPNRMRFDGSEFFMKTPDEMRQALRRTGPASKIDGMLEATREIADKCDLELPMGTLLMPHYPLPSAFANDMDGYLRHLSFETAKRRYGGVVPEPVRERLDFELKVIADMGFSGYFLIVQDFTTAARDLGVSVGPGRGSAAGSIVAYVLGITNIDPLKYDLLFERFLNPERVSMPDIDIDFDDRGRGKVIDYVVEKYGRENVCQIITFGSMKARSVIKDVSRVMGIPLPEANRIASLVPEGPKSSLTSARKDVPEFDALWNDQNPQIRKLMQHATVLEGSARHTGVHAAGVIIAPGDVSDYVPVAVSKSKGEEIVTTQYDGSWVEEFGLLKMDFLGLKTLTVLDDALRLIQENHGVVIDLDEIDLADAKTFELFQRGETVSIFQFESSGMREWMRKLKPTTLDDLIAMNALYRPGPMDYIPNYIARKHGTESVEFPHAMLEGILKPTYGIPVYQEQVMQMAQVMGGYSLGGADLLRRAMGKKKQSEMDKQRVIFVDGAAEKGVDAKTANEVFDIMAKFAGYGFNKSHAAAYSVVAYQTAYLKAHYPAEFMAAAMTNEIGSTDKLHTVLEEARAMGLSLLPPCVNRSDAHFTVESYVDEAGQPQQAIRFGMGAVRGAGLGAIAAITAARDEGDPFVTLFDLCKRLDLRAVNKKAIESLALAGAMDALEGHRGQVIEAVDAAVQYAHRAQADEAAGQSSLFGGGDVVGFDSEPNLPLVDPWPKGKLLKSEREMIGFYLSGHPLDAYRAETLAFSTANFSMADQLEAEQPPENERGFRRERGGRQHSFVGIVTEVNRKTTKSGKPMIFATIEDLHGQGELLVFSSTFDRVQVYLHTDAVVLVKGTVESKGGAVKVIVSDVMPMWRVREHMVRKLILRLEADRLTPDVASGLYDLCDEFRHGAGGGGSGCRVFFDLIDPSFPGGGQRVRSRTVVVDVEDEFMKRVYRLVGSEAVQVAGE